MEPVGAETGSVSDRFNAINLHDCELRAVHVQRRNEAGVDDVELVVDMVSDEDASMSSETRIRFLGCAGLSLRLDLWGKSFCGDAIAETFSEKASDRDIAFLDRDPRRQAIQPFESLFRFQVTLCPPGGELTILASDFELLPAAS